MFPGTTMGTEFPLAHINTAKTSLATRNRVPAAVSSSLPRLRWSGTIFPRLLKARARSSRARYFRTGFHLHLLPRVWRSLVVGRRHEVKPPFSSSTCGY